METGVKSDSSTAYKFTLEQLLTNKGKNMESTEALNFLHVSLQDKINYAVLNLDDI